MEQNGKLSIIRKAKKSVVEAVTVNEWQLDDCTDDLVLYVKALPGPKRKQFERDSVRGKYRKSPEELWTLMLLHCVFDDEQCTKPTFEGCTVDEIFDLNPIPRERVFDTALVVSGLKKSEIDQLVGN